MMILTIIVIIFSILFVLIRFNPSFGGKITQKQIKEFENLSNFRDRHFINQISTSLDMNFADGIKTLHEFYKFAEGREPSVQLPVMKAPINLKENQIIWFGHSTFLVILNRKTILIDPVFSKRSSPISFLGPKRYTMTFPIELDRLPAIDVVLISHDHYDHLDMNSIKVLNKKCGCFILPLGVDNHLKRWKIPDKKIKTLNWHDTVEYKDIKFIATPARHFSGRRTTDRSTTLWCSWIIHTEDFQFYYSGDSSYGPHFKQIYEKYGAMNLALLECGQYNVKWKNVHMFPEETVQAAIDLQAQVFMPIHWAGFTLSVHGWTEPVERVVERAKATNTKYTTPKIGEPILPNQHFYPSSQWWKEI